MGGKKDQANCLIPPVEHMAVGDWLRREMVGDSLEVFLWQGSQQSIARSYGSRHIELFRTEARKLPTFAHALSRNRTI
jgi:hypothetical protein